MCVYGVHEGVSGLTLVKPFMEYHKDVIDVNIKVCVCVPLCKTILCFMTRVHNVYKPAEIDNRVRSLTAVARPDKNTVNLANC